MFSALTKLSTKTGLLALLLVVAAGVAAQEAPHHALALTPSAVHAFAQEHEMDLQALEASYGKRRASNLSAPRRDRSESWSLFGRVGPMNFTNQLESSDGMQFTLRRTSHGLKGKIYIGIHRRF